MIFLKDLYAGKFTPCSAHHIGSVKLTTHIKLRGKNTFKKDYRVFSENPVLSMRVKQGESAILLFLKIPV